LSETVKRKVKVKVEVVDLAGIAVKMLRAKDAGKEAYKRSDDYLLKLLKHAKVGTVIPIPGGQVVEIVDNFADKNKGWGHGSVNRFDVKVSRATDVTAAL